MKIIILIFLVIILFSLKNNKFYETFSEKNILQNLELGKYQNQSAYPFISSDIWYSLHNNKNIYFLRNHQKGFPTLKKIKNLLDKKKNKVSFIISNQKDYSFPELGENIDIILNHKNLKNIYVFNPSIIHHKIIPIPLGPKWQFKSTLLFGENKDKLHKIYSENCATNSSEVIKLFNKKRINKIWIRPMGSGNPKTKRYIKNNSALKLPRYEIYNVLKKNNLPLEKDKYKLKQEQYLNKLRTYKYVISPSGNGLESHGTYEALMCGCIPIVPHSPLDPLFEDLPVILINSWDEISVKLLEEKYNEFKNKNLSFEKIYFPYWENLIKK